MHRFRLVTFDVIGTLLNFRTPPPTFYSEAASLFGIKAKASDIASIFRLEFEKISSRHPNFGQQTGIGWKKWWTQLVVDVLEKATNNQYTRNKYDSVAEYLITAYKDGEQYNITDGAEDLLSYLQQTNTVVGIISNYDERLHSVLKSLNLTKCFDFVLTSYEAGIEKPSPKIFEKALTLAKNINSDISPTFALHIGDKIETDYIGATKAGWQSALLKKNKDELLIKRLEKEGILMDYVFNDLLEFKARLPHL